MDCETNTIRSYTAIRYFWGGNYIVSTIYGIPGKQRGTKKLLDINKQALSSQLFEATKLGNAQEVIGILEHGIDVNCEDENGVTPLIWAAAKKEAEITHLLLEAGARVNHQDRRGYTALLESVHACSPQVVDEILHAGANAPGARH